MCEAGLKPHVLIVFLYGIFIDVLYYSAQLFNNVTYVEVKDDACAEWKSSVLYSLQQRSLMHHRPAFKADKYDQDKNCGIL